MKLIPLHGSQYGIPRMTRQANLILPGVRRDARPQSFWPTCDCQRRRPADSLSKSRSKSRHSITQRRFGDISFVSWGCAQPGKTRIEQNTLGARLWQCKCFTPARYEKQTCTSRSQPFIYSHSNSPLQQCNSFSSMLPQVLGATTKHCFVLHSAADVGRFGGGAGRTTVGCQYPVPQILIATVFLRRLGRREKCFGGKRHHLRFLLHYRLRGQSKRRKAADLCRMAKVSRNHRHQFRQDDLVAGA